MGKEWHTKIRCSPEALVVAKEVGGCVDGQLLVGVGCPSVLLPLAGGGRGDEGTRGRGDGRGKEGGGRRVAAFPSWMERVFGAAVWWVSECRTRVELGVDGRGKRSTARIQQTASGFCFAVEAPSSWSGGAIAC